MKFTPQIARRAAISISLIFFLIICFINVGADDGLAEAYIKLVNSTKSYPTVSLYVDGEGCGSAPQGDYCVCTVSVGKHNLKAVGVTADGKSDSATRTVSADVPGKTYTWTITD